MDLEYQLGRLVIDPEKLSHEGFSFNHASHLFVVRGLNDNALIYISPARKHSNVVERFELPNQEIVGGGFFYMNAGKKLVLRGSSVSYGGIPIEAAQKFGELILPELRSLGIDSQGVFPDTLSITSPKYWEKHGFIGKTI